MKRNASLDLVRAIAIITVLFSHLPPELHHFFGKISQNGGRGVDIFSLSRDFLSLKQPSKILQATILPGGAHSLFFGAISQDMAFVFCILIYITAG